MRQGEFLMTKTQKLLFVLEFWLLNFEKHSIQGIQIIAYSAVQALKTILILEINKESVLNDGHWNALHGNAFLVLSACDFFIFFGYHLIRKLQTD